MTDGTLEAVLRRERLIVAGALGVIVALAWVYVLWLAADMDMDGMNMSGFRMVPAGVGVMAPAAAPWSAVELLSLRRTRRREHQNPRYPESRPRWNDELCPRPRCLGGTRQRATSAAAGDHRLSPPVMMSSGEPGLSLLNCHICH